MPYLKSECTDELRDAIQAVENRADDCYRLLRLLRQPRNLATWALLTAMALEAETFLERYGANSFRHRVTLINLERYMCGFHFIAVHGKPASRLVQSYTYLASLKADATFALDVCRKYTSFLNVFPLWHRDHERADLMPNGAVRFYIPHDSAHQRQALAYQQIHRPAEALRNAPSQPQRSPLLQKLFDDLFQEARPAGLRKKFHYTPSPELIEALRPQYRERLDTNFRHPDSFQLNGYSLAEFKALYVGFLILCAIHEYICYPWDKEGHPISESSLVMVKRRTQWVAELSRISGLSAATTTAIVKDLTMHPENPSFTSLCITPFVPLDEHDETLAVAPQFPLSSAADENALRQFSYLYPALFSGQNVQKEDVLITLLKSANPGYVMDFSIPLPNGSTEIDILIEDAATSTVVFAELKWLRKPYKPLERLKRETELEKGINQLELIRQYGREHPEFLLERGKLSRNLSDYRAVHHVLLVRDYWHWLEPDDGIAVLDFDEFLAQFRESTSLYDLMTAVLSYDWLPVEGGSFYVDYTTTAVNGAMIEMALFHDGKRRA
jgi:hypothetical protein